MLKLETHGSAAWKPAPHCRSGGGCLETQVLCCLRGTEAFPRFPHEQVFGKQNVSLNLQEWRRETKEERMQAGVLWSRDKPSSLHTPWKNMGNHATLTFSTFSARRQLGLHLGNIAIINVLHVSCK